MTIQNYLEAALFLLVLVLALLLLVLAFIVLHSSWLAIRDNWRAYQARQDLQGFFAEKGKMQNVLTPLEFGNLFHCYLEREYERRG